MEDEGRKQKLLKEARDMTDEDRELNQLLRQTTLRLARETAELQARPTLYFIRAGILPALAVILIGVALAVGLTLLGRVL